MRHVDRTSFDFGLALLFTMIAALASLLAAYSGVMMNSRIEVQKGRVAQAETREAAYRMFAISVVLAGPAVWYGRVAVRGIRSRGRDA